MAKVHPVEKRLSEVLGVKRLSKDSDKSFQKKLHEAAVDCDDATWKKLGDDAQGWLNAVSAYYDHKDGKEGRSTWPEGYDDTAQSDPAPEPKGKDKDEEEDDDHSSKSTDEDEDDDMATSKKGGKKAPAKKSSKAPAKKASNGTGEGYKGHRAGSTKGAVHEAYDKKGPDAAFKLATSKGIKESSARSWIGSWGGFGKK